MLLFFAEMKRGINHRSVTECPSSANDEAVLAFNAILIDSLADNWSLDEFLKANGNKSAWPFFAI